MQSRASRPRGSFGRVVVGGAVLIAAGLAARPTFAGEQAEDVEAAVAAVPRPELPRVTAGVRAGFLLPALWLPEITLGLANGQKTGPQLTLSLVGTVLPPELAIGAGGTRTTVGGFLNLETRNRSGMYFSVGYAYYHAAPDSDGFWETDQTGYLTFGWLSRGENADFFIGGGLIGILSEEKACVGWCIEVIDVPPVLPTAEIGFRFHTTRRVR